MSIKPRTYQILRFLQDQETPVTIEKLSKVFQVSQRTIRYDLDELEEFLKKYEVELVKKPKVGVMLLGNKRNLEVLQEEYAKYREYNHYLSREERVYLILFKLFQQEEPLVLKQLDYLGVSNSTIIKDFDCVEKWLKKHNLKLIRKPNYGFKIDGSEIDMRYGVIALLEETSDEGEILAFLHRIHDKKLSEKRLKNYFIHEFNKIIGNVDLLELEKILMEAQESLGFKLADNDFVSLLIHIALAIVRLKLGRDIYLPRKNIETLKTVPEHNVAIFVAKKIEEIFEIGVPEVEISFITMHLLGARRRQDFYAFANNFTKDDFVVLAKEMTRVVSDRLKINLQDDQELICGLAVHLKSTINKIKYNLPLNNPILNEIKIKYPDIFKASELAGKILQLNLGKNIDEDEIGYIALHFGAAIERKGFSKLKKLRVLVVCSSGIGTSNILAARIKKEFKEIEITGLMSVVELQNNPDIKDVDLIVTTFNLDHVSIPVLKVSPLLDEEDVEKIKNILESRKRVFESSENANNIDIDELIEIIGKSSEIKDRKSLEESLVRYFGKRHIQITNRKEETNNGKSLLELMNERRIKSTVRVGDWKEAVRMSGNILLKEGCISSNYIEQSIKIIEEVGPYVVIAPNICLIHAKPENGAYETAISLLIVERGVSFNHRYDPVKLVFTLSAVDETTHVSALADLLKLINEKDFVEQVIKHKHSLISYIKKILSEGDERHDNS